MAGIVNSRNGNKATELSGKTKLISMYDLQLLTATDSIILTAVTNGITAIQNVFVCLSEKPNATCASIGASYSGLTVSVNAVTAAGVAATTFPKFNLLVIGTG